MKKKWKILVQAELGVLLLLGFLLLYKNIFKEYVTAPVSSFNTISYNTGNDLNSTTKNYEWKEIADVDSLSPSVTDQLLTENETGTDSETTTQDTADYIKWVDFNVSYAALNDAYQADVAAHGTETPLNWIELLAYLACKNGGDFAKYKSSELNQLTEKIRNKETTITELTAEMKYYNYYLEAYTAVLGGLVGEYRIEVADETKPEEKIWIDTYGLKGFSPIAKGFEYNDYDDFGVSRSYGYKRQHLGHDMMGQVGTPIIAIESGYVEAIGWNQYGGWRLGIRSFDGQRYYYYAHLRKNFPYNTTLEEGSIVQAGDVIGYLGRTGYSATENVNNIDTAHLHWGLQLIFDESQKEGNNEIWVDCYDLTRFLYKNRSQTVKNEETKEWFRVYEIEDPIATEYQKDWQKTSGN